MLNFRFLWYFSRSSQLCLKTQTRQPLRRTEAEILALMVEDGRGAAKRPEGVPGQVRGRKGSVVSWKLREEKISRRFQPRGY